MSKVFNMVGGGGGPAASIFVTGLSETDTVTATKGGKTLNGVWTQKPNPLAHGLPDGYTELEYIKSSGTQYIKSGIVANSDELTVECDGIAPGTGYALFGSEYSDNVGNFRAFEVTTSTATNSVRFNYYESTKDISSNPDGVLKLDRNNCYINGSLVHTFSPVSWSVKEIWLFARNNNGSISNAGDATIRYCKIWVADELVRHFIPCKNREGTLGLYDLVNDVFYTNAGTGTFIAGAEIPQTFDGFLIKPIRDFGTWTVTATDGVQTATQDVLVDVITEYDIEMLYSKLYLYRDGDECEDVTGGWTDDGYAVASGYTKQSGTKNSTYFEIRGQGNGIETVLGTNNSINLQAYSTINIEYNSVGASANSYLDIVTSKSTATENESDIPVSSDVQTISFDVSSLNDNKYIKVLTANATTRYIDVYKVWLE